MTWVNRLLPGFAMTLVALTSSIAYGQDIETLVMPGQVIAGHADIEEECSSCHKMFDKGAQRQLCLDCHEDVALDVNNGTGYHGRHPDAQDVKCASCHTDHLGRDADIVDLDEDTFDHSFTDFELDGAHVDTDCGDCHAENEKHSAAGSECVDCHSEEAPHGDTMGSDCGTCHQTTAWPDASFDHDTTEYPLLGKHQEATCLDCHEDRTFPEPPTDCYSCHADDDAHNGLSGQQCGSCHNPTDWHDSSFDHFRDTDFPLEGKHAEAACGDCHSERPFEDNLTGECASCHLEDDSHDGHNGEQCDSCHISTAWTDSTFDHDRDTDYRITGAHVEIACNACHVEPIFEVALQTSCNACHAKDDPHEGTLGTACESCHTDVNWQDPVFFDHDLTNFPLLGSHAETECEDCHATQAFTHAQTDCVACHREADPHRGNFTERCEDCHNPVAWDIWLFDHDTQTAFPLEGAHRDVSCDNCHRNTLSKMRVMDRNCRSCHRTDDIHDGEFGTDCGRCHTADSFTEVRSLQ